MSNIISIIDTSIYSLLMNIQCSLLDYFMIFITNFASAYVLIFIALLFILIKKNNFPAINLAIVFIINRILKLLFARERPQDVLHIVNETGYSFPSAHTMIATAFYGYLIYLVYKGNSKYKKLFIALLSTLILLIAISRVYLGAHYATDIIAGIIFGILYLIIFIKLSQR